MKNTKIIKSIVSVITMATLISSTSANALRNNGCDFGCDFGKCIEICQKLTDSIERQICMANCRHNGAFFLLESQGIMLSSNQGARLLIGKLLADS